MPADLMSCEDSSSSCFWSVPDAGVGAIQCGFILQLHVFKFHTPCVSAYSDRALSGPLCMVLKGCTSWLVRQRQTRHTASCIQGQLSVLLKCT